MTDVVYVLGAGSPWDNNELRYSLRSLEAFLTNVGRVYVVGHCPAWLTDVVHLPFPDRHGCKERNIMLKMAYACGHPDLSEYFLSIHDDHFALAPQSASDIPNWAGTSLGHLAKSVGQGNNWREAVINTDQALQSRGMTTHNFDIHLPMLINKNHFPAVMDQYDWSQPRGFVVKSLYGNTMGLDPVNTTDMKVNKHYTTAEIVDRLRGRAWFSLGNGGLNRYFKALLAALYPQPSRFELFP